MRRDQPRTIPASNRRCWLRNDESPNPTTTWVNIDVLAKQKKAKIVFVDEPQVPLRIKPKIALDIGGLYRTTKGRGSVSIYRRYRIRDNLQDIEIKLRSFIQNGVDIDRGDLKGFLSNTRVVCYSNSVDYTYIWLVIQTRFAVYRQYRRDTVPKTPVFIACQEVNVEEILPGSSLFTC